MYCCAGAQCRLRFYTNICNLASLRPRNELLPVSDRCDCTQFGVLCLYYNKRASRTKIRLVRFSGIGTALTTTHQYGNSLVMGITSPLVGERVGLQPLSSYNNQLIRSNLQKYTTYLKSHCVKKHTTTVKFDFPRSGSFWLCPPTPGIVAWNNFPTVPRTGKLRPSLSRRLHWRPTYSPPFKNRINRTDAFICHRGCQTVHFVQD